MLQKDVSYAKDWISGQRLMVPLSYRIWVFATWLRLFVTEKIGAGDVKVKKCDVNWSSKMDLGEIDELPLGLQDFII